MSFSSLPQQVLCVVSTLVLSVACDGTKSNEVVNNGTGGVTPGVGGGTAVGVGTGGIGGSTASSSGSVGSGGSPTVGSTTVGRGGNTTVGSTTVAQGGSTSVGSTTVGRGGNTTVGSTTVAQGGSTSASQGGASTSSGGKSASQGGTQATGGTSSATTSIPTNSWPTCNFTDAQIQAAYTAWRKSYVLDCPSTGAKRVVGCGSNVCSEGMGYGMLIAVNAADKSTFDGLWNLVDALIPVPSGVETVAGNNLLPWSIKSDCTVADYNNATDGDLDVAMSLIQAEKRWPGNAYLDKAIPIIKDILNKNTAVTNGKRVLLTGAKQKVADGGRPSYFAPAYYRVFIELFGRPAYADTAQVNGWTELLNSTYALLSASQSGTKGSLWPDWWPFEGTAPTGQSYGYDACRAPWRIATDFAWFGTTEASAALLAARAVEANPYKAVTGDKNSALVGSLAFTAMPAGQAAFQTACDQWIAGPLSDGVYFQDSLKLIYMQLAGGFFPSTL